MNQTPDRISERPPREAVSLFVRRLSQVNAALQRTSWVAYTSPRAPEEGVEREETMKARYTVVLSTLAGVAIGAAAIQTLHAQAKPPVYMVAINELTNPDR